MKASDVCVMLNHALDAGANIEALFGVYAFAPIAYAATSPIECFPDATDSNALFGALGIVNAIIEDAAEARIYLFRDLTSGKYQFRVTVKTS